MPIDTCQVLNEYMRRFCREKPSITCEKLLEKYEKMCEYTHSTYPLKKFK